MAGHLTERMLAVFRDQPVADQRHGLDAARSVMDAGYTEGDVVVAALMHDIGKRHSSLGLVGRSTASVMIILRLPMSTRMRAYRDHGELGADELSDLDAPRLAVDFARHHHGARPTSISGPVWDALVAADQPPKARPRP